MGERNQEQRLSRPSAFDSKIILNATIHSFKKLDPKIVFRNPVMFVVEIGSILTTFAWLNDLYIGQLKASIFSGLITFWLWITLLFANFAEAIAEGRGKAQADSLKMARMSTMAYRRLQSGEVEEIPLEKLKK